MNMNMSYISIRDLTSHRHYPAILIRIFISTVTMDAVHLMAKRFTSQSTTTTESICKFMDVVEVVKFIKAN